MRRTLRNPFKTHVKFPTKRFDTSIPPRRCGCPVGLHAFRFSTNTTRTIISELQNHKRSWVLQNILYLFGTRICPRFVFLRDFKGRQETQEPPEELQTRWGKRGRLGWKEKKRTRKQQSFGVSRCRPSISREQKGNREGSTRYSGIK